MKLLEITQFRVVLIHSTQELMHSATRWTSTELSKKELRVARILCILLYFCLQFLIVFALITLWYGWSNSSCRVGSLFCNEIFVGQTSGPGHQEAAISSVQPRKLRASLLPFVWESTFHTYPHQLQKTKHDYHDFTLHKHIARRCIILKRKDWQSRRPGSNRNTLQHQA